MTTPTPRTAASIKAGCEERALDARHSFGILYEYTEQLERDLAAAQEALQEREEAMHLRIRAEYDKTVADAWKAEVAKEQEARKTAEARAESYLEILREVDGLIKYQYSGSREAMSYLQHIANRVFAAIDAAREGK